MRKLTNAAGVMMGVLAMTAASPAVAGHPVDEPMTCPVGGEKFTHVGTTSYSTFGSRPDGKPYGSWFFPLPLPECPTNGLVIFDEFTPEQLAKLPALIAEPDYKARVKGDRPYYRAAWLMEKLGYPAHQVAWMVQQASWQADDDLALKRKYQAEFAARVAKLEGTLDPKHLVQMQVYAANALRELERFDEAIALLNRLDFTDYQKSAARFDPARDDNKNEAENDYYFMRFVNGLKAQSAAKNARSEALQLLADDNAKSKCKHDRESLIASEIAYCAAQKFDD